MVKFPTEGLVLAPQSESSGYYPTEPSVCFKTVANISYHFPCSKNVWSPPQKNVWVQDSRDGDVNDTSHLRNICFPFLHLGLSGLRGSNDQGRNAPPRDMLGF